MNSSCCAHVDQLMDDPRPRIKNGIETPLQAVISPLCSFYGSSSRAPMVINIVRNKNANTKYPMIF
jgi:hypothetical protein